MKVLVLDTSAFITGFGPDSSCDSSCHTYTVREVINEIKNRELKLKVELFLSDGSLKLVEPSKQALAYVKKMAEKSGDVSALSDTDLKVIALACDLKEEGSEVAVMTDDYGVQNVASMLKIAFTPAAEMGIKKIIMWKNICSACKKRFPPDFKGKCTVCGSKLRIIRT